LASSSVAHRRQMTWMHPATSCAFVWERYDPAACRSDVEAGDLPHTPHPLQSQIHPHSHGKGPAFATPFQTIICDMGCAWTAHHGFVPSGLERELAAAPQTIGTHSPPSITALLLRPRSNFISISTLT
jgi:hypothetical protein